MVTGLTALLMDSLKGRHRRPGQRTCCVRNATVSQILSEVCRFLPTGSLLVGRSWRRTRKLVQSQTAADGDGADDRNDREELRPKHSPVVISRRAVVSVSGAPIRPRFLIHPVRHDRSRRSRLLEPEVASTAASPHGGRDGGQSGRLCPFLDRRCVRFAPDLACWPREGCCLLGSSSEGDP